MSSRLEPPTLTNNTEELPRKCLVVRRSAPKKGVTKTEIRLVIYNETQKKDGLRKMEYPALMDASDMMADRLRDLETKNKKDAYAKDTEVRRQLEGVSRPAPTPDQEKEGIAKLKNAAPSMYNRSSLVTDSDVTTAEPIEKPSGTVIVDPSKKQSRDRKVKPAEPPSTTVTATTTVEDKSTVSTATEISRSSMSTVTTVSSCPERDCCMAQPCSNLKGRKNTAAAAAATAATPKKGRKKRRRVKEKQPEPSDSYSSPEDKKEPAKPQKAPLVLARISEPSEDSSVSAKKPARPVKKPTEPVESSDASETPADPLRKPPPHATKERKDNRIRVPEPAPEPKSEETVEPDEPKAAPKKKREVEPSEPRQPKSARAPLEPEPRKKKEPEAPEVPQESKRTKKPRGPKVAPEEPKEPTRAQEPLCDRRDCCMQQPCVKKGRKDKKPKEESQTEQPSVTEPSEKPAKDKKEKKRKRVDIVVDEQTATTRNDEVEESLDVLKCIYDKLNSSKPMKLKNHNDVEYVKAKILKVINMIEDKLTTGEKLKSADLQGIKNIVAMTPELRKGGNVLLATTVTVTESVSVEDYETD